jgi:hypothetical protein
MDGLEQSRQQNGTLAPIQYTFLMETAAYRKPESFTQFHNLTQLKI